MQLSNKQFNSKLNGVLRSASTQRDNIQELIISGLAQYEQHGNTGQLTLIIQGCVNVKSLPTTVIKEYIKAHANVAFQQNKNKDFVFKKIGTEVEVQIPQTTWYDWAGNKEARPQPDMNLIVRAKTFAKQLESALSNHKVKDVSEDEAQELLSSFKAFLQKNDTVRTVQATRA